MTQAERFFNRLADEYETQGRHKYLFYRWIVETIVRHVQDGKYNIVDVGTGTGELLLKLASKFRESRIVGIDISEAMIDKARDNAAKMRLHNVAFIISSVEDAEIEKVGSAVSCLAFHHIENKKMAMSKIYQALAENGRLIIGDWFKPCKKYMRDVQKLRTRHPKRTEEFDRSWQQALQAMSKRYKREHPREYPVCPHRLAEIMKTVGFNRQRIVKSPLASFAVVIGEKQQSLHGLTGFDQTKNSA